MKIFCNQSWRVSYHALQPIRGRVAIVRSQVDLCKVSKGDILVAYQTDVNYVPKMLEVVAVLTEDGGRYSHAATFSREQKIPCMTGVVGIMAEFKDGDIITISTQEKKITLERKGE